MYFSVRRCAEAMKISENAANLIAFSDQCHTWQIVFLKLPSYATDSLTAIWLATAVEPWPHQVYPLTRNKPCQISEWMNTLYFPHRYWIEKDSTTEFTVRNIYQNGIYELKISHAQLDTFITKIVSWFELLLNAFAVTQTRGSTWLHISPMTLIKNNYCMVWSKKFITFSHFSFSWLEVGYLFVICDCTFSLPEFGKQP